MNKDQVIKIVGIGSLIFLPLILVIVYAVLNHTPESGDTPSSSIGAVTTVDFRKLRELDPESGNITSSLKSLDNQLVRIAGFMVPLEDDQQAVSTFLLVPSPQACIHVPPPPSNQMILAKMAGGNKAKVLYGPIWLQGRLSLTSEQHHYGKSSFTMQGESVSRYE